ncbi:MAG: DsbE family thiol:disulfide interchange protein [Planctomycetes bacterium]|nr:DsbE family thiol:disulfide interchange protein [Planctomycetota bacterium]
MSASIESGTAEPQTATPAGRGRRTLLVVLPVVVFAGLAALLYGGLFRDPRLVPSPLVGKPVPNFDLPAVQGRDLAFASRDLEGDVSLVNVFASWCVACRDEHPLLVQLERSGAVPVHGLNYKDKPADAARWLDTFGDPYTRTGADISGKVGIEWGVYGVPETFVIGRDGRIAYKHIGPITERDLRETILPLVEKLRAGG